MSEEILAFFVGFLFGFLMGYLFKPCYLPKLSSEEENEKELIHKGH